MKLSRKEIFWRVFWAALTLNMIFWFYQIGLPSQKPARGFVVKNKIDYLIPHEYRGHYDYTIHKRVLVGIWQDTKKWDEVPVTVNTFYSTKINDNMFFDENKNRYEDILIEPFCFAINTTLLIISIIFWLIWIRFSIQWCRLKIADKCFSETYCKYCINHLRNL